MVQIKESSSETALEFMKNHWMVFFTEKKSIQQKDIMDKLFTQIEESEGIVEFVSIKKFRNKKYNSVNVECKPKEASDFFDEDIPF